MQITVDRKMAKHIFLKQTEKWLGYVNYYSENGVLEWKSWMTPQRRSRDLMRL
jgi:hypothetical protein